jgi:hypothetical protein
MRVLFQVAEFDRDGQRLQTAVEKIVSREDLEVLRTVEELESSLHTPLGEKAIGVFMASNVKDLKKLILLKSMMKNLSILLVVPNFDPETLGLAHLLLPRFLEHKGNEFDGLAQVLVHLKG